MVVVDRAHVLAGAIISKIIKRKIARPEIRELQIIVMKEMMSKM